LTLRTSVDVANINTQQQVGTCALISHPDEEEKTTFKGCSDEEEKTTFKGCDFEPKCPARCLRH